VRPDRKKRFCQGMQETMEILADEWDRLQAEGKFIEAGGILRDIDLILTVYHKLKCGSTRRKPK